MVRFDWTRPTMNPPQSGANDRIASLDLLRLIAALAVVVFHYFFRTTADAGAAVAGGYPEVAPYAIYGYLGVNLFFLISGFVIAWSAEGRHWRDFAIARFARIYPGFVVCMTITFIVMWLAGNPAFPVSALQYAANLFVFAPALGQPFMDGVYWSIVLELVFYGWVAVALFCGIFDRWKLELIAGWLALCASNELLVGSGAARILFVTEFGPLFAAGVLFRHLQTRGRSLEALMLLAAAFLLSTNTMSVTRDWMADHYGVAVPLAHLLIANLTIHAMIAAAIRWPSKGAENDALLALGGLTYPLYLLHQHIGYVVIDALQPLVGRWIAAVGVTAAMLLASWLVWCFIEPPARRWTRTALQIAAAGIEARMASLRSRPDVAIVQPASGSRK